MVKPEARPEVVAVEETLAETSVHCRVIRQLGSRLHPITKVHCDYLLCEYLIGIVENLDTSENIDARWVNKGELIRLVPVEQIFSPILSELSLLSNPPASC
jgi:hypothetical protein